MKDYIFEIYEDIKDMKTCIVDGTAVQRSAWLLRILAARKLEPPSVPLQLCPMECPMWQTCPLT